MPMNRERQIFSILLLAVNVMGAVGALVTLTDLTWGEVLRPGLFLCGVFLVCLFSVFFWRTRERRRLVLHLICFISVYAVCFLLFREWLLNSLGWGLQGFISQLNTRYGIYIIWPRTIEADAAEMTRNMTLSILMLLIPYVTLLAYGVMRSRVMAIVLADAVWFVAACGVDRFPDYIWLVLCVLGLGAVIILRSFRDEEKAGVRAAIFGTALLGVIMALAYHFVVPVFDQKYEDILEIRVALHDKINEEWIPRFQSIFAWRVAGTGVDVTGELNRKEGTIYISQDVYRVTFDRRPTSSVYLRGFVGQDYDGTEWIADKDSGMVSYYRDWDLELPESGGALVNLTYDIQNQEEGRVWVEELAEAGSYSLYPYGSCITEEYRVHWDGTVDRKGRKYEFPYRELGGYDGSGKIEGDRIQEELWYRRYVYDTFCEYPADKLPRLTEFLEESGFRSDNVYNSLADVLSYLRSNGIYNLDAGNPPKGEDFVEYFLFESGEGYCAHFASSAVLMLRYLGVPARYVTGYSASPGAFRMNEDGTWSTVIEDEQAHAWAEIYLDEVGWIPVEMTPGAIPFIRDNSMEQLTLAGQLSGVFDENHDVSQDLTPDEIQEESKEEPEDIQGEEWPNPGVDKPDLETVQSPDTQIEVEENPFGSGKENQQVGTSVQR